MCSMISWNLKLNQSIFSSFLYASRYFNLKSPAAIRATATLNMQCLIPYQATARTMRSFTARTMRSSNFADNNPNPCHSSTRQPTSFSLKLFLSKLCHLSQPVLCLGRMMVLCTPWHIDLAETCYLQYLGPLKGVRITLYSPCARRLRSVGLGVKRVSCISNGITWDIILNNVDTPYDWDVCVCVVNLWIRNVFVCK